MGRINDSPQASSTRCHFVFPIQSNLNQSNYKTHYQHIIYTNAYRVFGVFLRPISYKKRYMLS